MEKMNISDQNEQDNKDRPGENVTNAENDKTGEEINEKKQKAKKPFIKNKKTTKKLEETISELETRLNELNDKYLRLFSEFDNYRKRTGKERLDLLKTAGEDVIIGLLPVLDDFDRALSVIEKNGISEVDIEGIKLINNKLTSVLKKKGLEPLKVIGEPFDTDFHEALTSIPAPSDEMKGKVIDEIEKGYTLNGKVIRFAKVVVSQ
jgi:molecular chaperone GrpE